MNLHVASLALLSQVTYAAVDPWSIGAANVTVGDNDQIVDVSHVLADQPKNATVRLFTKDCINELDPNDVVKIISQKYTSNAVTLSSVLYAFDAAAMDRFGYSITVSSNVIVVAAPFNDDQANNRGSAYMYDSSGTLIKKLLPNNVESIQFGRSLFASNNVTVVGASLEDFNQTADMGTAYIYNSSGELQKRISAPDEQVSKQFGYSVAVSGNLIAVGAINDDSIAMECGAAYIFDSYGNYKMKLTPNDGVSGDSFGFSVATNGEIVVVGSSAHDVKGPDMGAAYIYDSSGILIKKVMPDVENDEGYLFGYKVAASENVIVVGCHNYRINGVLGWGSAFIYDLSGNLTKKLVSSDYVTANQEPPNFGWSVAASQDFIIVGAPLDDANGVVDSGSVWMYDTKGDFKKKLIYEGAVDSKTFGRSVAVSGDTVVVGAVQDNKNGDLSGSAHIFKIH